MVYRKMVCATIATFLLSISLSALEFTIRVTPEFAIPLGSDSGDLYSPGFGAILNADVPFFDHFSAGPEFSFFYLPLKNTGTNLQFMGAGLSAGWFTFPVSRLQTGAALSFGAYECMSKTSAYGNLWWKLSGNAAFRITPALNVGASAGYISYLYPDAPLFGGLLLGLTAQVSVDTKVSEGNIAVSLEQTEPVFPLFYGIYKENGIGTLTVTNDESAEIRDVVVSFRAGNYTASLMQCGAVPLIGKRKSVQLPLYADFASTVQNFTENGKMPGEIVVTYTLLGAKRQSVRTVVVPVYNRNTVRWIDSTVLASFISPNAPEVLDFSKYIVGIARDKLRTGLNRNMQFAMYLFEGLKTGGISYSGDTTTPYAAFHADQDKLDYIQYPFQTLAYHSGDLDDLGILLAACLESVGIRSAVIPLGNDFVVAFSLGIAPEDAEDLFASQDNLLVIDDEVWIPLAMSLVREGFINGWAGGVAGINEAIERGENLDFIVLREAWKTYPAASIVGSEAQFAKPDQAAVTRAVDTDLMRYVTSEFGPKIRAVQGRIAEEGASPALYNQLGLLYIRAGMYGEAKAEYGRSAELGSVTAMVNIGNLALLEKDFAAAGTWFRKALELQADNKAALAGLERVKLELSE